MKKVIELNQEEEKALLQLLDIALKTHGIGAINAVKHFIDKIENAPTVNDTENAE